MPYQEIDEDETTIRLELARMKSGDDLGNRQKL